MEHPVGLTSHNHVVLYLITACLQFQLEIAVGSAGKQRVREREGEEGEERGGEAAHQCQLQLHWAGDSNAP